MKICKQYAKSYKSYKNANGALTFLCAFLSPLERQAVFGKLGEMNEVNQRLRSATELAGISRAELASLLGVSRSTVNGWFSAGRTIPLVRQNAIAAIVRQVQRPERKYDEIVAFSVRLTPSEWQQLCEVAGATTLSHEEAEKKVRELLMAAWKKIRS